MTILTWILMAAAADSATSAIAPPATKTETIIEEVGLRQLLDIRRVYVDRLTGGETAAQMRDMLVSSLQGSKLFVITENQERADAILRGAAEDLVFTEVHSSSEGINARTNLGTNRVRAVIAAWAQAMASPADWASEKTRAATSKSANTRRSPRSGW
jgi:hypothetical protein